MGKRQFNENPKEVSGECDFFSHTRNASLQGIHWLVENNLVQNTPEQIAAFLFNETGLSKRAIGEYLGEKYVQHCELVRSLFDCILSRDDFHIDVLKQFARRHDFFGIDIVEALR